jgi:hypothetical protein
VNGRAKGKGREGKRRERRRGRGEEFGPPNVPDRSTPLVNMLAEEYREHRVCMIILQSD